jgi:dihydroorotase
MQFCDKQLLKPEQVVAKMCHAPADLFRISRRGYIREGYFADLVIADPKAPWTVSAENLLYKCKWSPFTGMTFSTSVTHTIINGNLVYEKGIFYEDRMGMRLEFDR